VEATHVLLGHPCDLPPLRFHSAVHGSYSVNQKQQLSFVPMSRREGSGQSHIPKNAPEETRRDDRPPSTPLTRYPDRPFPPSTHHSSSDPQYTQYNVPVASTRLSYPPEPSPPGDPRHAVHPQRRMEPSRSHERGVMFTGQGEYYPSETVPPPVHQPAPRQRTAVACRYCRRRKVWVTSLLTTDFRYGAQVTKVLLTVAVRTVSRETRNASFYQFLPRLMKLPVPKRLTLLHPKQCHRALESATDLQRNTIFLLHLQNIVYRRTHPPPNHAGHLRILPMSSRHHHQGRGKRSSGYLPRSPAWLLFRLV
jgi:hypothetical protein